MNSVKRHICDVKNWRLGHDLPSSVNDKSDSDVMFCLQSYQGLRIDRSLVY